MRSFIKNNKLFIFLSLIIFIGGFSRFYKLDWASGLFTHPDEYHIAASVSQLSFPTQMHPHFFSYGTVTIYLIYFTQEMLKYISSIFNFQFSIFNSFLLGRFYSALFSTLTIIIVYKICRSFMQTRLSYLSALLVALTPGLIQQAHFATPESALTFFLFGSLLFVIKFIQKNKVFYLILASIFLGFALGVKISSSVFFLPLVIAIILKACLKSPSAVIPTKARLAGRVEGFLSTTIGFRKIPRLHFVSLGMTLFKQTFRAFRIPFMSVCLIFTSFIVAIAIFALAAPFVFLDFPDFRGNFEYEGRLAIGKIPVFYTRQFIDTMPVLFQAEKILPYALGPTLVVFGTFGLLLIVYRHLGWWQKHQTFDFSEVNARRKILLIITIAFLSLFLPNAFLFAKWTRFTAPTFPFFAIFAVIALQTFAKKTQRSVYYFLASLLLIGTLLWTMSFSSIYINRDIRITASAWLETHAKPGSSFLVEGGNMIDIPLRGNFQRTSLSFYDLEDDPMTRERIIDALYSSDYFLVQSRRVFYNHQRLRHLYPKTAHFYDALFSDKLGFTKVKTFSSYPKLEVRSWKLEVADESAEETWSVFDHPVIRVFKKTKQLSKENYAKFLE